MSSARVGSFTKGSGRDALRFDDAWVDVHDMAVLAPDWGDEFAELCMRSTNCARRPVRG
jgi:hypothetical protein